MVWISFSMENITKYFKEKLVEKWIYVLTNTISSEYTFFSWTYYFGQEPFKCNWNYDPVIAGSVFYVGLLITCFISYLEHHYWYSVAPGLPNITFPTSLTTTAIAHKSYTNSTDIMDDEDEFL